MKCGRNFGIVEPSPDFLSYFNRPPSVDMVLCVQLHVWFYVWPNFHVAYIHSGYVLGLVWEQ